MMITIMCTSGDNWQVLTWFFVSLVPGRSLLEAWQQDIASISRAHNYIGIDSDFK